MDDNLKALLIGATILDINLEDATALSIVTTVGELHISIEYPRDAWTPNYDNPALDIDLFDCEDA